MTTKDRRLLKMILVIFVSFTICYLPITTTKIIRSLHKVPVFNIMGYLLIYLTTCINPIIYVVMSSEYRQAYWNLLMCRSAAAKRGKHNHNHHNHNQHPHNHFNHINHNNNAQLIQTINTSNNGSQKT